VRGNDLVERALRRPGRVRVPDGQERAEALLTQGFVVEAAEVLAGAAAALAADPAASADALLAALNAAMWAGPAEISKIARLPAPSPRTGPRSAFTPPGGGR